MSGSKSGSQSFTLKTNHLSLVPSYWILAEQFTQDIFFILSHKWTFQNKIRVYEMATECWPYCWWDSCIFQGEQQVTWDTCKFFLVAWHHWNFAGSLWGNNIATITKWFILNLFIKRHTEKIFSLLLSNTAVPIKRLDPFT